MSGFARIAGRVGLDVGVGLVRAKLAAMGVPPEMFGLVEEELNREGLTMGPLAKPSKLATFESKRAA
jgi:hypothetical protein